MRVASEEMSRAGLIARLNASRYVDPSRYLWVSIAGAAAAAVVIAAGVVNREASPSSRTPSMRPTLAARAIASEGAFLPYVASAFRRTSPNIAAGPAEAGHHSVAFGPAETGRHDSGLGVADPIPLFDPRESRALRALIAGVRDQRIDLTPLLKPSAPAPMELP